MTPMAICRIYEIPGATTAQYDEVTALAGDVVAAGAQVHVAGTAGTSLYVVEVWDSREALDAWLASQREAAAAQAQVMAAARWIDVDVHRVLTA